MEPSHVPSRPACVRHKQRIAAPFLRAEAPRKGAKECRRAAVARGAKRCRRPGPSVGAGAASSKTQGPEAGVGEWAAGGEPINESRHRRVSEQTVALSVALWQEGVQDLLDRVRGVAHNVTSGPESGLDRL